MNVMPAVVCVLLVNINFLIKKLYSKGVPINTSNFLKEHFYLFQFKMHNIAAKNFNGYG